MAAMTKTTKMEILWILLSSKRKGEIEEGRHHLMVAQDKDKHTAADVKLLPRIRRINEATDMVLKGISFNLGCGRKPTQIDILSPCDPTPSDVASRTRTLHKGIEMLQNTC